VLPMIWIGGCRESISIRECDSNPPGIGDRLGKGVDQKPELKHVRGTGLKYLLLNLKFSS